MKKGIIASIMAFVLMVPLFSSATSAAATEEFIMKPGETYEFVLVNPSKPTYTIHLAQLSLQSANKVDILQLDRDGKTIRKMNSVNGNPSPNVYAEGKTLVTNNGISNYKISYDTNEVIGQLVSEQYETVEQTGKVTIQPGESFRASYTALKVNAGVDVALDNPHGSAVSYSIYDNGQAIKASESGYFTVKVPYQGSVEFTNEGIKEVVLNYYTHWVTVSKINKTIPLQAVASIYNILAVEPGESLKVIDIKDNASVFTVDANGGSFVINFFNAAGLELTPPQEYEPGYKYTSPVTGFGDYAIITNTSSQDQSIFIEGRHSNYQFDRQ